MSLSPNAITHAQIDVFSSQYTPCIKTDVRRKTKRVPQGLVSSFVSSKVQGSVRLRDAKTAEVLALSHFFH